MQLEIDMQMGRRAAGACVEIQAEKPGGPKLPAGLIGYCAIRRAKSEPAISDLPARFIRGENKRLPAGVMSGGWKIDADRRRE